MKSSLAMMAVMALGACQMQAGPAPAGPLPEAGPPVSRPLPPMPERPARPGPAAPDRCGAEALAPLLGQPVPRPFPAPGPVRIVRQGDPMTMDHNPQRLTVITDRHSGVILSLSCG